MKDLKPISKTKFKKVAYNWPGQKAVVLFDQKNLGGEEIKANEEVTITGRRSSDQSLNIKNSEDVHIYGVHHSQLSHIESINQN